VKRILLVALLAACAKKQAEAPPVPPMSAAEIQRGQDACKAYVDQVCACAGKLPAVKPQCDLARALPDALNLQLGLAAAPESKRNDVVSAQAGVRKVIKECIEETARLPALGCQ
jgi:hypothetical protein